MGRFKDAETREGGGFLGRLRRDARGNTLAMMAIALIPVSALAGSAVDTARLYVVKVRLQQACDAGVLAGRKFMTDSDATTLDSNATTQANTFFKDNFKPDSGPPSPLSDTSGYMGSRSVTFTPVKTSDNQVAGTASATVPMTVMQMFGMSSRTLSVSCQARFDVADADVMFVLDTTGSMACLTSDDSSTCDSYDVSNTVQNSDGRYSVTEKSNSRIAGLRSAVLSFYDTVTSEADPSTHFRYGFVPYSATTNVGGLLSRAYMTPSSWNYQTRTYSGFQNYGNATSTTTNGVTQAACTAKAGQSPWQSNVPTGTGGSAVNGGYTATVTTVTSWTASGKGSTTGACVTSGQPIEAQFTYAQKTLDVSNFASGVAVANPAMLDGSSNSWNGCVEERGGSSTATTFSTTSPPLDLDVDTAPSASIANSYWGPMWPEVEFARQNQTSEASYAYRDKLTRYQYGGAFGTYQLAHLLNEIACPKAAQRLQSMSRTDISNYLSASSGFRPYGNTYHDAGMTWGTRLLSPSGMFASDTAAWPGHNAPNRYIIFLTDGDMEPDEYAYTTHGMEQFDNRVGSNGDSNQLKNIHNARFAAACTIAKNHNIKIFVIGYAQTLTSQLSACASPNEAFYASDSSSLTTAFQQIAQQIAMLRLSQ